MTSNIVVQRYLLTKVLAGLLFTVPVWVAFENRFLTYAQMAMLESASQFISIFLQLPTGALADIVGRKWAVSIGYLLYGVGSFVAAFVGNAPQLVAVFLWNSVALTFISGADVALLYDALKADGREKEFAHINAKALIYVRMSMIGAMFLGGILSTVFIGLPYMSKGVAMVLAGLIFITISEPKIDSDGYTVREYFSKMKNGFSILFSSKIMSLRSLYYISVGGISWSVIYYYMNTIANDVGYTPQLQGYLFAGMYIVSNFFMILVTKFRHIFSEKLIICGFPVLLLIGFLPGKVLGFYSVIPFLTLLIFLGGLRFTVLDGWINEFFPSDKRATAISALNMMVTICMSILLFVLSPIQQNYLTTTVFSTLGLITLFTVVPLTMILIRTINQLKGGVI